MLLWAVLELCLGIFFSNCAPKRGHFVVQWQYRRLLGAGWQCGYPNICPGFVPCQNMSNQWLTYVLILSLPNIWLVFSHNTQLLSSINLSLVLSANLCPVFVPKFSQFLSKSITKWQDRTWTKIGLNCFNINHLVTLYLDIRWTNTGHS